MDTYDEGTYGERIAEIYDQLYPEIDDSAIDLLQELAAGGPALELGVGTGRVAIPLQSRGLEVSGIDASQAMIAELRAKPGGRTIKVFETSFAEFSLGAKFSLVYVVFNTLYALLTQEEQLSCLGAVAAHLMPKGRFLVEAFVPDLCRYKRHQNLSVVHLENERLQLDASQLDPVAQQVTSQHILLSDEGIKLYPVKLRYIWPAELDLMAQIAGLKLVNRWGDWDRRAFTPECGRHISIYTRAG